jgi:hypothetical protein
VFTGTPAELVAERGSITGRHLRRRLASEVQGPTATSAPWCRGESASSTRATARSA